MNTSNVTMKDFNEQSSQFRIPTLVFLGIMLPLGILGNASVIYIFGFRLKTSNYNLFIALLAVVDIICCLVSIPMEIFRMYFFYNYPSNAACKIEGFFAYACFICSVIMLLNISVERYLRVCRSTKPQMSRKVAKVLAGAAYLVSSLLAVPISLFANTEPNAMENGNIIRCCLYRIKPELVLYAYILFTFLLSVYAAMFVLYWRVLKTAKEHMTWAQPRLETGLPSADAIHTSQVRKTEKDKMLRRTNRQFIWISLVYGASFIPDFIVSMFMAHFTHPKAPNPLDVLLFLVFEAWILNCTVNPIVYGFLNSKFRAEFRNHFTLIKSR